MADCVVINMASFNEDMNEEGLEGWHNNEVQFARLLCEMTAALDRDVLTNAIHDMAVSMDLSAVFVESLFRRAHIVWLRAIERNKAR